MATAVLYVFIITYIIYNCLNIGRSNSNVLRFNTTVSIDTNDSVLIGNVKLSATITGGNAADACRWGAQGLFLSDDYLLIDMFSFISIVVLVTGTNWAIDVYSRLLIILVK